MEDGTGGVAPHVQERAEVAVPERLAVDGVGDGAGRSEPGEHAMAVGYGGTRTLRVSLVGRLHAGKGGVTPPQELAAGPIEAEHTADRSAILGARHKNAAPPDDRRRIPRPRQWHFPLDVL